MSLLQVKKQCLPKLDRGFLPAALWNQAYEEMACSHLEFRSVQFGIGRPDGTLYRFSTRLLPDRANFAALNLRYCERLVKFLLWAWGGHRVLVEGAPEIANLLASIYSPNGSRSFDYDFMGDAVFGQRFSVAAGKVGEAPSGLLDAHGDSRKLDGCRIGFDLGGSDRKCAAVVDGEVVFSEEIKWSPYFEKDPNYHIEGIRDSLTRVAKHLPRVDAIGGSAAGIYIDNEPRVGSLFRGLSSEDFDQHIRGVFKEIEREWNVPVVVANDGDVTALAGAMSLNDNAVLGLSMGTSEAVGYVDGTGKVRGWLNELAFAPVDYREDAPLDEWSGDAGCGVQYFSQQAVGRLIPASGLDISAELALPEQLESVQESAQSGDGRALDIYRTIGTYLGYTIAHYSSFYDFRNLLMLGRVTSGVGGELIIENAREVLELEFPHLHESVSLSMPDEKMKRHGQAIAAAALPVLTPQTQEI